MLEDLLLLPSDTIGQRHRSPKHLKVTRLFGSAERKPPQEPSDEE